MPTVLSDHLKLLKVRYLVNRLHVPPLRPLTMEGRVEGEDEDPIPETSTNHAQPKQASPRELGKLLSAAVGQMFYR